MQATQVEMSESNLAEKLPEVIAKIIQGINQPTGNSLDNDICYGMAGAKTALLSKRWSRNYLKQVWSSANNRHETESSLDLVEKTFFKDLLQDISSNADSARDSVSHPDMSYLTSRYEDEARVHYITEKKSLEFYEKLHFEICKSINDKYPDLVRGSNPVFSIDEQLRGKFKDHSGVEHKLVDGIKAANMIYQGLMPEIPFCESYLMHQELDRIGAFKSIKGTAHKAGSRTCNLSRAAYVVYHQDAAGNRHRDAHFWSYMSHTSNRHEMPGWGDLPGEIQIDTRTGDASWDIRPEFLVTYVLRCGCDGDFEQLDLNEFLTTYREELNLIEGSSRIETVLGVVTERVPPEQRVDWQPSHAVNISMSVIQRGFDEEEIQLKGLTHSDKLALKATISRLYAGTQMIATVQWDQVNILKPDHEEIDFSNQAQAPTAC